MWIRSFLALEIPSALKQDIIDCQHRFRSRLPPVSWVKTSAMHLTLKFFGDIESKDVDIIHEEVTRICHGYLNFSLSLEGMGVFPNVTMPKILWIGVTGDLQPLDNLVRDVDENLELLGFIKEAKPFRPHLTLARIRSQSKEVGQALARVGVLEQAHFFGKFPVKMVSLFQSALTPQGSVYTRLWEANLSTASH